MDNIIKNLRGRLSQAAFAKKVGVAQATIATYELGRVPTLDKLERIAKAAGKKITLLIEDSDEKDINEISINNNITDDRMFK